MPLGLEIGLGQATLCSTGTQLPPEKRHIHPHPIFGPCVLWPNGWMNHDATWYGGMRRSGDVVLAGVTAPLKRGTAPSFRFMSIAAKWLDG